MTKRFLGLGVLASALAAQTNTRVFITDSASWAVDGARGGARSQTVEIMKTFGERCEGVTVTRTQDKADFVVLLDHEGGKGLARRDNKVAVFNRDGDMIHSGSTRTLGNAIKDACDAIRKNRE